MAELKRLATPPEPGPGVLTGLRAVEVELTEREPRPPAPPVSDGDDLFRGCQAGGTR